MCEQKPPKTLTKTEIGENGDCFKLWKKENQGDVFKRLSPDQISQIFKFSLTSSDIIQTYASQPNFKGLSIKRKLIGHTCGFQD